MFNMNHITLNKNNNFRNLSKYTSQNITENHFNDIKYKNQPVKPKNFLEEFQNVKDRTSNNMYNNKQTGIFNKEVLKRTENIKNNDLNLRRGYNSQQKFNSNSIVINTSIDKNKIQNNNFIRGKNVHLSISSKDKNEQKQENSSYTQIMQKKKKKKNKDAPNLNLIKKQQSEKLHKRYKEKN